MKKAILILSVLISANAFSQDLKTGKWKIDGVIIERKDSIQIEHTPDGIDTLRVEWLSKASYRLNKTGFPALVVHITKTDKKGYFGLVTDGNRVKRFRAEAMTCNFQAE